MTIADGVVLYACKRHGGYWLAKHREQLRRNRFPQFQTFAGGPWYEEDIDATIVMLTFPELFHDDQLISATRAVEAYQTRKTHRLPAPCWLYVLQWYATDHADVVAIKTRVARRKEQVKHLWEKGSYWTASQGNYPRGTWGVVLDRPATNERKTVYMPYPDRRYYTDNDLASLEVKPFAVAE